MAVPKANPDDYFLLPMPEEFPLTVTPGTKFFSVAERVIIMITCVLVSIASVMLMVGIVDLYMFIGDLQDAFRSWGTRLDGM